MNRLTFLNYSQCHHAKQCKRNNKSCLPSDNACRERAYPPDRSGIFFCEAVASLAYDSLSNGPTLSRLPFPTLIYTMTCLVSCSSPTFHLGRTLGAVLRLLPPWFTREQMSFETRVPTQSKRFMRVNPAQCLNFATGTLNPK